VMIAKTTPEQEVAAWLFVKWFTSPEIQARWTGVSGYFPTRAQHRPTSSQKSSWATPNTCRGRTAPFSAYEPQLISYTAVRDATTTAFNRDHAGRRHSEHFGYADHLRQRTRRSDDGRSPVNSSREKTLSRRGAKFCPPSAQPNFITLNASKYRRLPSSCRSPSSPTNAGATPPDL
jgi:hypothetical protein